jgi:hypothetical protein
MSRPFDGSLLWPTNLWCSMRLLRALVLKDGNPAIYPRLRAAQNW